MAGEDAQDPLQGDALLDRHDLYERLVQDPRRQLPWLLARLEAAGIPGRRFAEDFAGTAALSLRWVREVPGGSALAVEHDAEALRHGDDHPGLERRLGDVIEATSAEDRADLLFVGNFSIGYWWTRELLLRYLRHAALRLAGGGLLVIEIYGGASAWRSGEDARRLRIADGRELEATWEQRDADITSGMVSDFLHFRVLRDGTVQQEMREAFSYRLRLWSLPELRDALSECGFDEARLFDLRDPGENGPRRVLSGEDLGEGYLSWVVARAPSQPGMGYTR